MTTSTPVLVVPSTVVKPCARCSCPKVAHEHGPEHALAGCVFCDRCRRFRRSRLLWFPGKKAER